MSSPMPHPVLLSIRDSARAPTPAALSVRVLSVGRRLGRALARLGIAWGLIVPTLFIPVVHFVMPFVLLGLGLFLAVRAVRQSVMLLAGAIVCPKCGQQVEIMEGTPGWPACLYCGSCGSTLVATPSGMPGERVQFANTAPGESSRGGSA